MPRACPPISPENLPDWHGGFSLFAVEKFVAPRGDQIPVIQFQTTAPPSRVNFREIRGPGVCGEKTRTGKQKLDTEGAKNSGLERKNAPVFGAHNEKKHPPVLSRCLMVIELFQPEIAGILTGTLALDLAV